MDISSKFFLPGLLFSLTLAFGFWVSNAGKPYNGLLFNLHKLIALAAVVIAVIQFPKTFQTVYSLALMLALLSLAVLCVLALFASGALLSLGKLEYALMLTIHRVALVALIFALGLAVYLLKIG